jgi:hypothetical protein
MVDPRRRREGRRAAILCWVILATWNVGWPGDGIARIVGLIGVTAAATYSSPNQTNTLSNSSSSNPIASATWSASTRIARDFAVSS